MKRLLFLLLLFQSVAFAAEDYKAALELYNSKHYTEAFKILKNLNKDDQEKSRAALLIGTMYFEKKKVKKARKFFDSADPEYLTKDTAFAYGSTYLEFEQYEKALIGFRYNLKIKGPKRALTRYRAGICYYKIGQLSRAEKYFQATNPKSLPKSVQLERQRFLQDTRKKQDDFLSSFVNNDTEVRSPGTLPRDSEGNAVDPDDWTEAPAPSNWGINWKPGFMLRQESAQMSNQGNGSDTLDNLIHRVGLRTYAGGDPSEKRFGSFDFGLGLTGYSARQQHSQTFSLPGADGLFLSQQDARVSEENLYLAIQPQINFELTQNLRAELGAGYAAFLPHSEISKTWGQSEAFARIRADAGDLDGGMEFALQQPFDQAAHELSSDMLVKGDINQRLGEMTLRLNAQDWKAGNTKFTAFDHNRMTLVDGRFKYHLGFSSESKLGLSGSMSFADVSIRLSYDLTLRKSDLPIERLSAIDDPETVAKQANKRLLIVSFPIGDTVSLSAATGSQNLSGYTYRSRDETTGEVIHTYDSDVKQELLQLGVAVVVVDWIKIRLNYSLGKNSYTDPSTHDDAFAQHNPRANETSIMHIEVNKSF